MAKQNYSDYHYLYLTLKDTDDYFPKEDRTELLTIIKKLYDKYQDSEEDDDGTYGLRYKTIHDDSSYYDTHEQFFNSKIKRDNVLSDWEEGLYWDNVFQEELQYRTPYPNFVGAIKIFKHSGKIYEE